MKKNEPFVRKPQMRKLAPARAKTIAFISQQQKWHHKMPLFGMVEVRGVEPLSEMEST
ncbi:MAG: hypothetical protein Q4G55_00815 [bacterium]|nr:hypothetical protein [bacterium]